jgi:hypothetical protein
MEKTRHLYRVILRKGMKYQSVIRGLSLSTVVLISLGCSGSAALSTDSDFQHDLSGDVVPWNSEVFAAAGDQFTFAVFSDLTGGERANIRNCRRAVISVATGVHHQCGRPD